MRKRKLPARTFHFVVGLVGGLEASLEPAVLLDP